MTSNPIESDPMLRAYFAARGKAATERLEAMWGALTARERDLVREAAVHGYAYAASHPPEDRSDYPSDAVVVMRVLSGCDSMPDLYPTISALGR